MQLTTLWSFHDNTPSLDGKTEITFDSSQKSCSFNAQRYRRHRTIVSIAQSLQGEAEKLFYNKSL